MDIRDYLRMLKRGWPAVLLIAALFVALAVAYLALTPKRYQATAVLFVSASEPTSIVDLQQGLQFSNNVVATYAEIVDSITVLGPVASELRPQRNVDDLVAMIAATVRPGTTLIDVTAEGEDPEAVATVANAAAKSATSVIPSLEQSANGQSLVRIQQIRPAIEPNAPVSPNARNVLALGLIVGSCIGLGATIATQALDTRIRRVHDLRVLTQIPLLAALPRIQRKLQRRVIVRDDPTGASGEAFRTLRTNIRFLESQDQRSLVFAAVADGCDGAEVPANLAWMLAEAGHSVLLGDLDLRQANVGGALGIPASAGMADVLAGKLQLSDVVLSTDHPNLQVVLSGTTPPRPSELLDTQMMRDIVRLMEEKYHYVILNAPPLLSYTDAAVISSAVGGTLVTVTVGRTRAQELSTAITVLANVGITPLGLVLTRAGRSALDHRKGSGRRSRPRFRIGRPMLHRFDWDWRRNDSQKPPQPSRSRHRARRDAADMDRPVQ